MSVRVTQDARLWPWLCSLLGVRQPAVRRGAVRGRPSAAAETLDARTMLSGINVLYVTATDGADVSVNATADGIDKVVVTSQARIGELFVTGGSEDLRVTTLRGSVVGSIDYAGGTGRDSLWVYGQVDGGVRMHDVSFAESQLGEPGPRTVDDTFVLAGTGRTGQLDIRLRSSQDRIVVTGQAEASGRDGRHRLDASWGDDRVAVVGAEFTGGVAVWAGHGLDRIAVRDTTVADGLEVDGYHGNDFVQLTRVQAGEVRLSGLGMTDPGVASTNRYGITDLTVTGDFEVTGDGFGRSRDEIGFAGRTEVGGRMRLFLATDDDKVAFAETIVGGSQELYLGSSVGTDSVRFGDDTIGGGSTVASIGSLRVSETAARQVTGAYIVAAGGGDPYQYTVSRATGDESAVIRLDAGSSATTVEVTTDLRGLAFVDLDGVSVAGTMVVDVSVSEDSLVVATDLRVESTVGIFAGGGDPAEVRISGAVFADLTVTLGDGNDTLRLDLDESETSIRGFERIFDGGDGIDRLINAPLGVWAVNFEL